MANRNYQNDYPSVTQVLVILRKPGLENWFKYNSAQFCNAESSKGKQIGTEIHDAIQSHIEKREVKIETQYGEEVATALKSFMLFRKEHPEIKLIKSEIQLTSLIWGYNGTMDVSGRIEPDIVPGDWKSGKAKDEDKPKIYPEHIYQVASYLKVYNEVTHSEAKKAFIAVFAKDKVAYNYRLIEEQVINEVFDEVFLPCLKIHNYQRRK